MSSQYYRVLSRNRGTLRNNTAELDDYETDLQSRMGLYVTGADVFDSDLDCSDASSVETLYEENLDNESDIAHPNYFHLSQRFEYEQYPDLSCASFWSGIPCLFLEVNTGIHMAMFFVDLIINQTGFYLNKLSDVKKGDYFSSLYGDSYSTKFNIAMAAFPLFAALGSMVSLFNGSKTGRTTILKISNFLFILGSLVSVFSPGFTCAMFSQMFSGIASGLTASVLPIYISEIFSKKYKEYFVSMIITARGIGTIIAVFATSSFGYEVGRIISNVVPGILSLIVACLSNFILESPVFYIINGNREKAINMLNYFDLSTSEISMLEHESNQTTSINLRSSTSTVIPNRQQTAGHENTLEAQPLEHDNKSDLVEEFEAQVLENSARLSLFSVIDSPHVKQIFKASFLMFFGGVLDISLLFYMYYFSEALVLWNVNEISNDFGFIIMYCVLVVVSSIISGLVVDKIKKQSMLIVSSLCVFVFSLCLVGFTKTKYENIRELCLFFLVLCHGLGIAIIPHVSLVKLSSFRHSVQMSSLAYTAYWIGMLISREIFVNSFRYFGFVAATLFALISAFFGIAFIIIF
ncbi:hypothetical protein BB560_004726 [Smittium megazygosporum]|uniref:Major facilitator superfamily (MFS) profile domain-containing protein n=1 Tax=Smittium megazygosporum TaxID=133381 RepID=A0A2T9Z8F3_9FUNG|nr:hypothetical protein BB560_004726 [Smittium megazygosporum]